MIIHDWDEAKNRALLRRSFEALQRPGTTNPFLERRLQLFLVHRRHGDDDHLA
jgi:hypothetical protein